MASIVDKPLDNIYVEGQGPVTKSELRSILKKINVQVPDVNGNAYLEVFEVLEIKTKAERNQKDVIGRYCYSGQSDIETNTFKPANSNMIQYPMVGELWLGFEYKGESFYLSRLSDSNVSVNYQKLGESEKVISPGVDNTGTKTKKIDILSRPFGIDKKNINPIPVSFEEGSTLFQGRFNNHIVLGSDSDNEGVITLNNNDSSRIRMFKNKVDILAENDININSNDGDVLINAKDKIEFKPAGSTIINNIKNGGTILSLTKDGFPFGQLDMIGFLKQVTGIQKLFQALTIGIPKLSNPLTLVSGVKDIQKGLEGAQQFVDATINLEFISKVLMETKTIDEIKAVLPVPGGFTGIIDDISKITDEQIKNLEKLEKSAKDKIQKATELQDALSGKSGGGITGIKTLLDSGDFDSFKGIEDLKQVIESGVDEEALNRYIDNGGLSSFEDEISDLGDNIGITKQAKSYQKLFKKARS